MTHPLATPSGKSFSDLRWLALPVWLAVLGISVLKLGSLPGLDTDLTTFMPRAPGQAGRLAIEQLRGGPAARLILVALEGDDDVRLAAASKTLADKLRASELFANVENGAGASVRSFSRDLFAYRYLLSPATDALRFRAAALRAALNERLYELTSPLASFDKASLPADPSAAFRGLLERWRPRFAPARQHGVWFSPDNKRALLLAYTSASGFNLQDQSFAVDAIRGAFNAIDPGANLRLLLSGPAVFAVDARDRMRDTTQSLSMIASAFLIVLLLLIYRSPRAVLIGALPLLTAMLVGASSVTAIFGSLHGITLAFGITLLGVVLDYPLHLFSHREHGETAGATLARIWPTLRLGVLTTTLAYLVMGLTRFTGMAQLGVFAASGLLAAAAVTRWIVPLLLSTAWRSPFEPVRAGWMDALLKPPLWTRWLPMAAVVLSVVFVAGRGEPVWERDVAALSPVSGNLRALDQDLRAQLGAPDVRHVLLITAADAETALQSSEALAPTLEGWIADGIIDGFDMANRYLPSREVQRKRQAALPGAMELERDLATALTGLGFKPGLFRPFRMDVAASVKLYPLGPADLAGTALGARVGTLLYPRAGGWVSMIQLQGVKQAHRIAESLTRTPVANVSHVDLKAVSSSAINTFRDRALERLGWGSLAVVLLLSIALRNTRRLIAVCLPLLVALIVDVALLIAIGERLSLFHLIALILVVGIGLDYSLFFSLPDRDEHQRRRTLHALMACAVSTTTVFGIIASSEIPVLRAMGASVALGVVASFLAAMLLSQQRTEPR